MQRALIIAAMVALVFVALSAGALAAHWPFWQRAWQWRFAEQGWPEPLSGPTLTLRPAASATSLTIEMDPSLAANAQGTQTTLLLVGDAKRTRAYFAAGTNIHTPVDGRELSGALQVLLYGALIQQGRPKLLDEPVRLALDEWSADPRGVITPRQLFWQLSGLSGGPFSSLNPFSPLAQLQSGPDFQRAVLRTPLRYPPGSHFAASIANAQLLALVATRHSGDSQGAALERYLWSRLAADPATLLLDRRRGEVAAHCCVTASAGDWLRLGLLLANRGRSHDQQIMPADFVEEVATASPVNPGQGLGFRIIAGTGGQRWLQLATTGRRLLVAPDSGTTLLWVGTGEPPPGLEALLLQGQRSKVR